MDKPDINWSNNPHAFPQPEVMGTTDGCLFFLMWPHLTLAMCFHEAELNSETDILLCESQANLYAQRGVDKTERESGVIYWELSQLSDQSTARMWRDLYKRITAGIVHTHNKLTLHEYARWCVQMPV